MKAGRSGVKRLEGLYGIPDGEVVAATVDSLKARPAFTYPERS